MTDEFLHYKCALMCREGVFVFSVWAQDPDAASITARAVLAMHGIQAFAQNTNLDDE